LASYRFTVFGILTNLDQAYHRVDANVKMSRAS